MSALRGTILIPVARQDDNKADIFEIADLKRDAKGIWHANLLIDGETHSVERESGSWMYKGDAGWKELLPFVSSALQKQVRKIEVHEKAETKERDAEEEVDAYEDYED